MPTLGEFVKRAKQEFGATERSVTLGGGRGPSTIQVLERRGSDVNYVPIPTLPSGAILTPTVLRSLCRQLGIPPSEFGLTLD